MKKLIPIILIFLLFSSCKKIIKKNSDYEGNWYGDPYSSTRFNLNIDSNSNLEYWKNEGISSFKDHITGKARMSFKKIHVGNHCFTVIAPPTKIDTTSQLISPSNNYFHWKMELRSPKLYGGYDVTYYRE